MNDAVNEAVEGFVEWANAYVAKAQQELKITTDKIQAGTFGADDAVDAMVRSASFWFNSMAGLAAETMDAAATMAKYSAQRTIESDELTVGQPGSWTLSLAGPLVSGRGDALPVGSLQIVPSQVADGTADTFVVRAKIQEVPGAIYAGEVVATNQDGSGSTASITVKLQVP